jgi:hypothetical protein
VGLTFVTRLTAGPKANVKSETPLKTYIY